MITRRHVLLKLLLITVLAAFVAACQLFKSTEKTVEHVEKITEKVEQKVEQAGKEKSPTETHQGPLVDNKVIAMRVQDALKREGAEFQHVTVDGSKAEVVMTGTVASAKAKSRAEEIARSVEPKIKLKNELKVGQ